MEKHVQEVWKGSNGERNDLVPRYQHIKQNDFLHRKHKKQKEEDIANCDCKFDANNPESACGESCLNLLTSTECTPGFCPCGVYCKNQRFQKCDYAKTKLFKTNGYGWGLLADEDIQVGHFIIEYCGEVISWKEAKLRTQAYENQGLKDAFIISLNSCECIDATKKGTLARLINHSCLPNCETRKWNVLGELRVGIFAKQDIPMGTELTYNYNFEWYGGVKVRCLCGADSCSGFLGAKSRGFQEDTYLWEDDDDRYSVEDIPLYDSAEDEPSAKLPKLKSSSISECGISRGIENGEITSSTAVSSEHSQSGALIVHPFAAVPVELEAAPASPLKSTTGNNAVVTPVGTIGASHNGQSQHRQATAEQLKHIFSGNLRNLKRRQVKARDVVKLLALEEAQKEVAAYEDMKMEARCKLDALYGDIRPVIEEHERDTQDSVATSVAEKWIQAACLELKAEFNFHSSIIKNLAIAAGRTAPSHEYERPSTSRDDDDHLASFFLQPTKI